MTTTVTGRADSAGAPAAGGSRKLTERVFRIRESGIIAVFVVFVAVTTAIEPSFLDRAEHPVPADQHHRVRAARAGRDDGGGQPERGPVDRFRARPDRLRVGGLFGDHPGIPVPLVFLIGLGIGLACGLGNGLMVAIGRVPSLVVTLATLYIIRGIDILLVGGTQVNAQTLPNAFTDIPRVNVAGVPYLAIAVAVVIGLGAYYLRSYRSGRELYAIGSNPDAARLAGIPVGRRVLTAFAVSGAIAGLAGVLWAAQYQTVDSSAGTGYELTVISAVVVGGVAIFGGSGSAVGAAVGALLLSAINSALNVLGISSLWLEAISGFLLLVAITLDRVISLRLQAALRRRSSGVGT